MIIKGPLEKLQEIQDPGISLWTTTYELLTCSRYLFMMSSSADWCSARETLNSLFSCSRFCIRWFSNCEPNMRVDRGRWSAISFNLFTSSCVEQKWLRIIQSQSQSHGLGPREIVLFCRCFLVLEFLTTNMCCFYHAAQGSLSTCYFAQFCSSNSFLVISWIQKEIWMKSHNRLVIWFSEIERRWIFHLPCTVAWRWVYSAGLWPQKWGCPPSYHDRWGAVWASSHLLTSDPFNIVLCLFTEILWYSFIEGGQGDILTDLISKIPSSLFL